MSLPFPRSAVSSPLLSAAALALLAVPGAEEVLLTDAPAPGASRSVAVSVELVQRGGELEVEMNGSPVPADYLPELDLDVTDRRELEVVDAYDDEGDAGDAGDEGGEGWVRTFEVLAWTNAGRMAISGEVGDEEFPWDAAGVSPLEGRAVRFAGGAAVGFADGREGDAGLFAGLQADLGLGELLPADPVEPGATWSVDGARLAGLFEPGGDLAWEMPPAAVAHLLPEVRSRELGGELELELERVADGRAHCRVRGELVRTTVQPGDLSQVPVTDGAATDTVTATWTVAGELVWSVAEHRLVELALDGPYLEQTRTVRDAGQPGPSYASLFTVEGTRRMSVACEVAAAVEGSAPR